MTRSVRDPNMLLRGLDYESDGIRRHYGIEFIPRLETLVVETKSANVNIHRPTYADYRNQCESHDLDFGIFVDSIRSAVNNGAHAVAIQVEVYRAYQKGLLDARAESERDIEESSTEETDSTEVVALMVGQDVTVFGVPFKVDEICQSHNQTPTLKMKHLSEYQKRQR